jgi:hypothetical protein
MEARQDKTYLVTGLALLATALLFWYLLPYPVRVYIDSIGAARYQSQWAISLPEYRIARSLARSQMALLEIITGVNVESPTKVTFDTLTRWQGPLAASGQIITLEKRDGRWTVTRAAHWIS